MALLDLEPLAGRSSLFEFARKMSERASQNLKCVTRYSSLNRKIEISMFFIHALILYNSRHTATHVTPVVSMFQTFLIRKERVHNFLQNSTSHGAQEDTTELQWGNNDHTRAVQWHKMAKGHANTSS